MKIFEGEPKPPYVYYFNVKNNLGPRCKDRIQNEENRIKLVTNLTKYDKK